MSNVVPDLFDSGANPSAFVKPVSYTTYEIDMAANEYPETLCVFVVGNG